MEKTVSRTIEKQYPQNAEIAEWQQIIDTDPCGVEKLQARIRGMYGSHEWLIRFNAGDQDMLGFLAWAQARVVEEQQAHEDEKWAIMARSGCFMSDQKKKA